MVVVARTSTMSSFALVTLQRFQSAPTSRKFWGGGKENRPAGKMGSKFMDVKARFSSFESGGAGVLELHIFNLSKFDLSSQVLEGGNIGCFRDNKCTGSGDSYRVLLVDDASHSEKLVEKVLPQVIPCVTPVDARFLFHVSRKSGVAVVIITVKEHAEFYSEMMVRKGLQSTIEPHSDYML